MRATSSVLYVFTAVAIAGAVACTAKADVEKVPVGSDVQLTRQDGGVVQGKLAEKDANTVKVVSGSSRTPKVVPRSEIADVKVVDAAKPAELPPIAKFREYSVPEGTPLRLTIQSAVSSDTSRVEDAVEAKLADAVTVDGTTVLPAGSAVRGNVSAAQAAGKVSGVASLGLHFTTLTAYNERIPISARWSAEGQSTKKEDAKKIGIGAGAGAIIGGIIGGKKGAAIGAGGAGLYAFNRRAARSHFTVALASGSEITVKLANGIDVRVPVNR